MRAKRIIRLWPLVKEITLSKVELATTGTKIILVLVEGRPRLLNGTAELAHAVVYAGLPCELGGEAIADLIFGKINPSGKMPLTYPKSSDLINMELLTMAAKATIVFYTNFTYSNMQLSATSLSPSRNKVTVSVTVANTGSLAGKESVLLFVKAPNGPETRLLKAFNKVDLAAGASTVVSFTLTSDDFGRYVNEIGAGLHKIADAGTYLVSFKATTDCQKSTIGDLCKSFTWTPPAGQTTPPPAPTPPPASVAGYYNLCMDGFGVQLSNTANDTLALVTPVSGNTRQEWYYRHR
ncbi:unnamed protein product [Aphanomyces euteiches]